MVQLSLPKVSERFGARAEDAGVFGLLGAAFEHAPHAPVQHRRMLRLLLLILAVLLPAVEVLAEDLRTNDGTVYHQLKEVKAEPDGLVFVYDKGIAKVDFERLSPEMQRRFGYDLSLIHI